MSNLVVLNKDVSFFKVNDEDYISITDIARYKETLRTDDLIRNWLRNRMTLEFLGIWEKIYNPKFNPVEFDGFKLAAGLNTFTLTPKQWIEKTHAIGLISKPGRYGGTFAHKDIAFEFATWISVEFKLYMIKEFQRLKENEQKQFGWSIKRDLAKINYRIHTDAIKNNLIPQQLTKKQIEIIYANEADLLNVALFGITSREWNKRKRIKENIRDFANIAQLICLSNLENINALFINEGLNQKIRVQRLNKIAIHQMKILTQESGVKQIDDKSKKIECDQRRL